MLFFGRARKAWQSWRKYWWRLWILEEKLILWGYMWSWTCYQIYNGMVEINGYPCVLLTHLKPESSWLFASCCSQTFFIHSDLTCFERWIEFLKISQSKVQTYPNRQAAINAAISCSTLLHYKFLLLNIVKPCILFLQLDKYAQLCGGMLDKIPLRYFGVCAHHQTRYEKVPNDQEPCLPKILNALL